jgi:hypothetical protein
MSVPLRKHRGASARLAIGASVGVLVLGPAMAASGATDPPVQIGVTFTNALVPSDCRIENSFVKTYDRPGVRRTARLQLAAMRAAGIDTINTLLWHFSSPEPDDTNNIPSQSGKIPEPYRTNLIRFVSDIRDAGFKNLTVDYSPQWTNNPLGQWGPSGLVDDNWDPTTLAENFAFIRDTRSLIKQYGPAETWFDPAMELEPTDYIETLLPQRLDDYLAEIYRRYVAAFGKDDLVFFVGGSGDYLPAVSERFTHLIAALSGTGLGLPPRFGIHSGTWDQSLYGATLRLVDATLDAHGLNQPLVIGEAPGEGANSAAVAQTIADFIRTSGREVPEVFTWWSAALFSHCQSPPYSADSYLRALTGSAHGTALTVTAGRNGILFKTPYDSAVTALEAGRYEITIADTSPGANFHLTGPGIDRRTGVGFRGRTTWAVSLREGSYSYRSDQPRGSKGNVVVVFTANRTR